MDKIQRILITYIASMSALLLLVLIFCVISFILIKRLNMDKYLYFLVAVFMVIAMILCANEVVLVSMDLYFQSIETYRGTVSSPARDTVVLNDDNKTKLFAAVSIPETNKEITVLYTRRSKIAVCVYN